MEKDDIFVMAERYVKATGKSVFLTGKAGTGKTTFLKYITETVNKRYIVLAPTGVAAINAGGTTIHSFFHLPLCPYLPDVKELVTEYQMPQKTHTLRKERIKIIRTLDLLIIDEISMVRADLLDAVDMTLRKYRCNGKPFGGVQLLMIGDAQQLSPVVKENEWKYMSQVYDSPYFFHSKALAKLSYVTVELEKIHRQKDSEFVEILNSIRENRITSSVLDRLNKRLHAYPDTGDVIRLTTHNSQSDEVNSRKLKSLSGEPVHFEAEVEGDFPQNSYPADSTLVLKEGAQVMFIRNDSCGEFYNGKLGWVERILDTGAVVVRDAEGQSIAVSPVEWENSQYVLDDKSGEITRSVVGKFRQLPLRIAWAITIHKSQGLTFDKVIIDAGAAFAFGQVYVALSRCRSLEGISLESPIRFTSIYSDSHVAQFNASIPPREVVVSALGREEQAYVYNVLRDIFDFDSVCTYLRRLRKMWGDDLADIYPDEYQRLLSEVAGMEDCAGVASNFRVQLSRIQLSEPDDGTYLHERLSKASAYFLPVLEGVRDLCIRLSDLEIDNKEIRKKFREIMETIMTELDVLCSSLAAVANTDFTPEEYNRIRNECLLKDRDVKPVRKLRRILREEGEEGIVNEKLREELQRWRAERFKADNVPAYTIMHQSTLMEIASLIPKTKSELLAIKGFGKIKLDKYGDDILKITSAYWQESK